MTLLIFRTLALDICKHGYIVFGPTKSNLLQKGPEHLKVAFCDVFFDADSETPPWHRIKTHP